MHRVQHSRPQHGFEAIFEVNAKDCVVLAPEGRKGVANALRLSCRGAFAEGALEDHDHR